LEKVIVRVGGGSMGSKTRQSNGISLSLCVLAECGEVQLRVCRKEKRVAAGFDRSLDFIVIKRTSSSSFFDLFLLFFYYTHAMNEDERQQLFS
jgi:hypothetical protein